MGKYDSERHTRTDLGYCGGSVSLTFNGETLEMYAVIDKIAATRVYKAVSGKPDANQSFDYSLERQKKSDEGPIPEGKYWIYPYEFWKNGMFKRGSYEAWGNYRITLHPDKKTETHGRGGFFIHGGYYPGSIGCVDLTENMDKFYEDLMKAIDENTFCQISLWVDYKPKSAGRPR